MEQNTLVKSVVLENRLAVAVTDIVKNFAFSPQYQGERRFTGRIEGISYDIKIVHALGSIYGTGTIGHCSVIIHGQCNQIWRAWVTENSDEVGHDGPLTTPTAEGNPHSNVSIDLLFSTLFDWVGYHASRNKITRQGKYEGVQILIRAEMDVAASKLAYLLANKRALITSWNSLESMDWAPVKTEVLDSNDLVVERPSGYRLTMGRAPTGTIAIRTWKPGDTKNPVTERKVLLGVIDQLDGDHSDVNQFILEGMTTILELEKQPNETDIAS